MSCIDCVDGWCVMNCYPMKGRNPMEVCYDYKRSGVYSRWKSARDIEDFLSSRRIRIAKFSAMGRRGYVIRRLEEGMSIRQVAKLIDRSVVRIHQLKRSYEQYIKRWPNGKYIPKINKRDVFRDYLEELNEMCREDTDEYILQWCEGVI